MALSGLFVCFVASGFGATKKNAPVKKAAASTAKKSSTHRSGKHTKTAATKTPVKSKTPGKTARNASKSRTASARSRKAAPKAVARHTYQSGPTQERYQEIQQALSQRGHFKGEANGEWGPESVEALKRFQQEQNLTPSGKLDSVSLIALGLGPKRNLASSSAPQSTQPRPQQDDNRRPEGSQRP